MGSYNNMSNPEIKTFGVGEGGSLDIFLTGRLETIER